VRARRWAAAGLLLALGFAAAARPAFVTGDGAEGWMLLWRGQRGEIRFVNSVTEKPVEIRFRVGRRFEGFSVATDPLTESYYTAGAYALNELASGEAVEAIRLCSMRGIDLRVGFHERHVAGGCLEVRLLWTL